MHKRIVWVKRLFQEIVEINKTTIHTEVFCKQSGSFQIVHTKKKLFLKIWARGIHKGASFPAMKFSYTFTFDNILWQRYTVCYCLTNAPL